jgi:hypothetical protein
MSEIREAKKLLETRKYKELRAQKKYKEAQEEYERAAAKHLPTADKLRRRARYYRSWVAKRTRWTKEARERYWNLKAKQRAEVKPERTRLSVNQSSRGGAKPRKIVLHITVSHNRPGLGDIDAILNYFDQPSTDASSHIINDAEGHDARCVEDRFKAWTQAAHNPDSLSIEQVEYADKSTERWRKENKRQLENTAKWIAHWSHLYGIPIKHSTSNGVCQHRDLGVAGGGHSDVGPNYPFNFVLERARHYRKALYGH